MNVYSFSVSTNSEFFVLLMTYMPKTSSLRSECQDGIDYRHLKRLFANCFYNSLNCSPVFSAQIRLTAPVHALLLYLLVFLPFSFNYFLLRLIHPQISSNAILQFLFQLTKFWVTIYIK